MSEQYIDLDSDSPSQWPGEGWDRREFSKCNQEELKRVLLRVKPKAILEIGVSRLTTNKYENTSTAIFLNHKDRGCVYIGVDIEDKSYLTGDNVHTLKCDSANIGQVMDFARPILYSAYEEDEIRLPGYFDFIFIDGWHSINQVMKEWEYRHFLNPGGVIGLHDTNYHPGPKFLLETIKEDKELSKQWKVEKCCLLDWGITFIYANNKP